MNLSLEQYSIPFTKPLRSAKGLIHQREGLWVSYKDDHKTYYGEAAPLPGFSTETLGQTLDFFNVHQSVCANYLQNGLSLHPTLDLESILNAFQHLPSVFRDIPVTSSALFALDSILLQKWVLNHNPVVLPPVALNALVSSELDAENAVNDGFQTIKMKIGVDVTREIELLKRIHSRWSALNIRLDANEAWTNDEAYVYIPLFAQINPEYIEEPFLNLYESGKLRKHFNIQIAADESARTMADVRRHIYDNTCDVFIIKPMLCNGLLNTLCIIREAMNNDKKVVITSSLDTGLSRRSYALIASLFLHKQTHGLATGSFLSEDLWGDGLLTRSGFYHPEAYFNKH